MLRGCKTFLLTAIALVSIHIGLLIGYLILDLLVMDKNSLLNKIKGKAPGYETFD
jgi:hypothetical protein